MPVAPAVLKLFRESGQPSAAENMRPIRRLAAAFLLADPFNLLQVQDAGNLLAISSLGPIYGVYAQVGWGL